jgi:hypothetical protein
MNLAHKSVGVLFLAIGALTILWAPTWGASANSVYIGGHASVARFQNRTLTFWYPSSWTVYRRQVVLSNFSNLLVRFSTTNLGDPCKSSLQRCQHPLNSLGKNQLLVDWLSGGIPGWKLARAPGRHITVGGQPAKLLTTREPASWCPRDTGISITASIAAPSVRSAFYRVTVCIGAGSSPALEQQILKMLHSVTFRST